MKTQINVIRFPLVTITYGEVVTDADMAAVNLALSQVLMRKQPFALVCDMTRGAPSVSQSETVKAFVNTRRDEFRRLVVLNVLVITSGPLRALVRAAMLVVKPPYPAAIETTVEGAEVLCNGALSERRRSA